MCFFLSTKYFCKYLPKAIVTYLNGLTTPSSLKTNVKDIYLQPRYGFHICISFQLETTYICYFQRHGNFCFGYFGFCYLNGEQKTKKTENSFLLLCNFPNLLINLWPKHCQNEKNIIMYEKPNISSFPYRYCTELSSSSTCPRGQFSWKKLKV